MTEARTSCTSASTAPASAAPWCSSRAASSSPCRCPGRALRRWPTSSGRPRSCGSARCCCARGIAINCLPQPRRRRLTRPRTARPRRARPRPARPRASPHDLAERSSSAPAKASSSSSKGSGQAVGATRLGAASAPQASTSAKASSLGQGVQLGQPGSSASPSPSATSSAPERHRRPTKVNKATLALFNKLNCADKNWQQKIYGNSGGLGQHQRADRVLWHAPRPGSSTCWPTRAGHRRRS